VDRAALTAAIKTEAARLGFEWVGVTTPDPPPHLDVYRAWLARRRQGSMAYLAAERAVSRRADPRRILPSCRSILVVGMRHAPPPSADGPRLAAYALGEDYHRVVLERLERLMTFLQPRAAEPFEYRLYTDTGPLLERELAQRAGLGWIGKNTCLIHPRHGSYFLLGEALVSEPLEPDAPFVADRCGTCTRCLDACPTACILPDRTIDARRCISYQTIENRGPIPPDLRPAIGDWIFGCDVCQQVCPWNVRFAAPTPIPEFEPAPGSASPDPRAFLEGTAPLRRSPLTRAGRNGMARNAAVVMGHRPRAEDVEALGRALIEHADPIVRGHAAWALGQIGGAAAEACLRRAAKTETDSGAQKEIDAALASLRSSGGEDPAQG